MPIWGFLVILILAAYTLYYGTKKTGGNVLSVFYHWLMKELHHGKLVAFWLIFTALVLMLLYGTNEKLAIWETIFSKPWTALLAVVLYVSVVLMAAPAIRLAIKGELGLTEVWKKRLNVGVPILVGVIAVVLMSSNISQDEQQATQDTTVSSSAQLSVNQGTPKQATVQQTSTPPQRYSTQVKAPAPQPQTFSISGMRFEDKNQNGEWDDGEVPVYNWEIQLGKPATALTRTRHGGVYSFEGLAPGVYTVCEKRRADWGQSYPGGHSCHSVTIVDRDVVGVDFASYRIDLSP